MPPVTLAAVVDLSKIKMKWKETYVSEGLNRKVIPAAPKGIYRGLQLIQNISSPRQVEVSVSGETIHAAVHQSATGFSTTYHDPAGGSTILNLSSASLDNMETVITLSISYTVGADTTASWIAYPIADWNALTDAQRAEKVVLGTVNVPAPATNITTAMILPNRRSLAWDNVSPGAAPWNPMLKNSGFEIAEVGASYAHAAAYWEFHPTANALWKVQQTSPRTGDKVLTLEYTATGVQNASFEQWIGSAVAPGTQLKYQLFVQNLKVPSVGTSIQLRFRYSNTSFDTEVDQNVTIPMATVDAAYREISGVVAVPATCAVLTSIAIVNALGEGTTGVAYRIDDFQVWMQSSVSQPAGLDRHRQAVNTSALVIEDQDDPFAIMYGQAALFTQVADELTLERRDQNKTSASPILLALRTAQITQLGADLLNTEARALLPRIQAGVSVVGGVDFTLMWESVPSGQPGFRKYVSSNGSFIETYNAVWGGSTWAKDVGGVVAVKRSLTNLENRVDLRHLGNNAAWADGSWDQTAMSETWGNPISIWQIVASASISGDLTMGNNSSVAISGTGKYRRGQKKNAVNVGHGTVSSSYSTITLPSMGVTTSSSGVAAQTQIPVQEGETLVSVQLVYNAIAAGAWTCQLFRATGAGRVDCFSGGAVASVSTGTGVTLTITANQNNINDGSFHYNFYVLTIHQNTDADELFLFEYITKVDP